MCSCSRDDSSGKTLLPLEEQLATQLAQSQAQDVTYNKKVYNLNIKGAEPEVKTFTIIDSNIILSDELGHILRKVHNDPFLEELYQVNTNGDTLLATIQQPASGELQSQEVLQEGNLIRYIRSQYRRKSWLYTWEMDIAVDFDSMGMYESHSLTTFTEILGVSKQLHARIEGRLAND